VITVGDGLDVGWNSSKTLLIMTGATPNRAHTHSFASHMLMYRFSQSSESYGARNSNSSEMAAVYATYSAGLNADGWSDRDARGFELSMTMCTQDC
jgi:outer membrane usher protein FimD/PapC